MLFLDLVKIYNVFYIMTMETLDRYKRMSSSEMNKALVLYKNFCNFTETLKKEANTIPMLFGFTFKEPNYYKPDPKKERAMKNAMNEKERGGFDEDQEGSFGDEMPDLDGHENLGIAKNDYDEAKDDEDSDDDYNFDILGDARKQEQMASVHGAKRSGTVANKNQKIKVDDFNTAALDDLLAGEEKPPARSETVKASAFQTTGEEEWDPFANNDGNVYSSEMPRNEPAPPTQPSSKVNNIFGDEEDDVWGGNSNSRVSDPIQGKAKQQTLEDILGGDSEDVVGSRSQSMAVPQSQNNDFDLLKNLYNTSTAMGVTGGGNMGGGQQDYYNTAMPSSGYGGHSNTMYNTGANVGYNQPSNYGGGMGYDQNQFNTGYNNMGGYNNYGGGYNTMGGGYNNMGGGYGNMGGGGYGNMGGAQNTGYSTSAPGTQQNQNNTGFDPFA